MVDVLSELLRLASPKRAEIRQLIQRPPWSLAFADPPWLTVIATLKGSGWIRFVDPEMRPVFVAPGDIALLAGGVPHTIADAPSTPPQVIIRGGAKFPADNGPRTAQADHQLRSRTYGDGLPGATVLLRGAYELGGLTAGRLRNLIPPVAVVPADPRTQPALDLLNAEVDREEPGHDAVLDQLLGLVLVHALRAWCARPGADQPGWYQALKHPNIGAALNLLHEQPAYPWTVGTLASQVGMSRASFAARFAQLVGTPPGTYLTEWRMTLAADRLQDSKATLATVAREVGYTDTFAFSVAFKRAHGLSPSIWRRQPT